MSTETTETTEVETQMAPQNWGGADGKSIMELMDGIDFGTGDAVPIKETKPAKETKPDAKAEVKTDAKPEVKEPAKDDKQDAKAEEAEDEPVIDEDFFALEKKDGKDDKKEPEKKDDDAFNEDKFEAETLKLSEGMEGKAGEKFKELRAELKALKQAKPEAPAELKAELETLRTKAAEVDGLRSRLEEVSSISAKVKVEQSDDYAKQITKPASDLFSRSDALAAEYEMNPAVLRAIIKEGDRARVKELIDEHLKPFHDVDKSDVFRMAQDFRGLVAKREEMLADAEKSLEKSEKARIDEQNRLIEEHRGAVQTTQKQIWEKYRDIIPGFTDDDGKPTAVFKELMGKGMSIDFSTSRARDQAFAAFAGVALPHVMKEVTALRKEIAERDKADGKEVKKRPRASESIKETEVKDPAPQGDTFMERLASARFTS